jgi:hypothetical protein
LILNNDPNTSINYTNLGKTFKLPNGIKNDSESARNYLGGANEFKTEEIEAF